MSTNLASMMMNDFRGDTLNRIASALGESTAKTQSALSGVFTAILGGLANKASTAEGANDLLNVIHENKLDTDQFANLPGVLSSSNGINSLMSVGKPLLGSTLGGRTNALTDWISSFSGLKSSSSSSLLTLALPMVLGFLSRRVSSLGGGPRSLMNLLGEQREFLSEAPSGLVGALGADQGRPLVASFESESVRPVVGSYETETRSRPVVGAYAPEVRKASRWWIWPLLLIPLLAIIGWLFSRREAPVVQTPAASVRTAPPEPVPLIDKELKLDFDRIEFETNSAQIRSVSQEQIRDIARIMKDNPGVNIKIGGHTDNVGDPAANLQLSQDRAANTMKGIVAQGIDPSRLAAEGYGEQLPIADNATEEGRQRNRRIEIQVTRK